MCIFLGVWNKPQHILLIALLLLSFNKYVSACSFLGPVLCVRDSSEQNQSYGPLGADISSLEDRRWVNKSDTPCNEVISAMDMVLDKNMSELRDELKNVKETQNWAMCIYVGEDLTEDSMCKRPGAGGHLAGECKGSWCDWRGRGRAGWTVWECVCMYVCI